MKQGLKCSTRLVRVRYCGLRVRSVATDFGSTLSKTVRDVNVAHKFRVKQLNYRGR